MTDSSARPTSSVRHLPWFIVAAILVGVIAITLVRGNGAANPEEAPSVGAQPAVAPAAAMSDTTALRRRPAAVDDAGNMIAARRNEQRKNVQQTVDTSQSALAMQFQSEKIDAGWAPAKEQALTGLSSSEQIKQLDVDIRNLSVDCKTKVCRITGDFPTMSKGDDWFTLYMNNVAAEIPYASYKYVPHPDGSVRIEVYGVGRK